MIKVTEPQTIPLIVKGNPQRIRGYYLMCIKCHNLQVFLDMKKGNPKNPIQQGA